MASSSCSSDLMAERIYAAISPRVTSWGLTVSRKLSPRLTARESETTWTARASLGSDARERPAGSLGRVGATLGLGTVADVATGGAVAAAMFAEPGVGLRTGVSVNGDAGSGVNLIAEVGRGAIVRAGMVFSGVVTVGNAVGVTITAEVGVVTGGGSVGAGWAEQPAQTSSNVVSRATAGLTTEIPIGPHQI